MTSGSVSDESRENYDAEQMAECLVDDIEGQSSTKITSVKSGTSPMQAQRSRRPNSRFPRSSVRILEKWLSEHHQSPYPTLSDQDELKARTGLKRSQISNWFANARKRGKVQSAQSSSLYSEDHTRPSLVFSQIANLHPFERWLSLGVEHEAAATSAIVEAVTRANEISEDLVKISTQLRRNHSGSSTNWQYFRKSGSSISSMEIRSYAANVKSVRSDQWKYTEGPSAALSQSARRRRRLPAQVGVGSETKITRNLIRKFQCTFCTERFKTKHDWQRHEKSQHLPLERWTCSPHGGVNVNSVTNEITCVFCETVDPDPEHIKEHKYTACVGRAPVERTFYRKDHLRQHLRLMHENCLLLPSMDSWKSAANMIRSRCGFCDTVFNTWDDRVDHLAEHFCSGTSLSEWIGDWGFDEEVLKILERASLPGIRQEPVMSGYSLNSTSVDDYDYGLFLDLESSQFGTELSADYQYAETDGFDQSLIWDGMLEYPADACISKTPHTGSMNTSVSVHGFIDPSNKSFECGNKDLQNPTSLSTEYQQLFLNAQAPGLWTSVEEEEHIDVNVVAPSSGSYDSVVGIDLESLMFADPFALYDFAL